MKMPFGKYAGFPVSSVPDHALYWYIEMTQLRPALLQAVCAELETRSQRRRTPEAPTRQRILPPISSAGKTAEQRGKP